jgi:hypothetical protein
MTIIKYAIVLILLAHGAGHAMGFLAAWTRLPMGFVDRPWVFGGDVKIETPIGRAFGLFWLGALGGFVAAGIGVLLRQGWWSVSVFWGAVVSIVAILPWWNTITPSARVWPILVDVLALAVLLGPWRDQIARIIG